MGNSEKKEESFDKAKIKDNNGLNIEYDKKELKEFLPHLIGEIQNNQKSLKIDEVDYHIESTEESDENQFESCNVDDLQNPTVLDFIRRCKTKEEAKEILEYLYNRNEITKKLYNDLSKEIEKELGLTNLIEKSGGFKRPGYYLRKYYIKNFNKNKNLKNPED